MSETDNALRAYYAERAEHWRAAAAAQRAAGDEHLAVLGDGWTADNEWLANRAARDAADTEAMRLEELDAAPARQEVYNGD